MLTRVLAEGRHSSLHTHHDPHGGPVRQTKNCWAHDQRRPPPTMTRKEDVVVASTVGRTRWHGTAVDTAAACRRRSAEVQLPAPERTSSRPARASSALLASTASIW